MNFHRTAFTSIGWFIPAYVNVGFLDVLAREITESNGGFSQSQLEDVLARIHAPRSLAAKVTELYPIAPFVQEYQQIIAESVEAHATRLHHIAASGLIPVIEGVGKKLASDRNVDHKNIQRTFVNLVKHCKDELAVKPRGNVGELVSMLDSFGEFAEQHLYTGTAEYFLSDNTNRHGIVHGTYTDADYGAPINFYKAISALDFLCLIVALRAQMPSLLPSPTARSIALEQHYERCARIASERPA
jgi:hypothetical protein